MDVLMMIGGTILDQFQKPTLAFLIGGVLLAAMGSKLEIPQPVYKFIVIVLLLKVGLGAGMSVKEAELSALIVPAIGAALIGVIVVVAGGWLLTRWKSVSQADGFATAGLFGAVSASTLAAGMAVLDDEGIVYEGFIGALYPFMDVAALVTAIVLAKVSVLKSEPTANQDGTATMGGGGRQVTGLEKGIVSGILKDTVRSPAISALLIGIMIGLFADPSSVYGSFYEPLFRGLLSILMLIMGMEAWARLSELRGVAHAYLFYGLTAPLVHGMLGFGVGVLAHEWVGFSQGGVVLLAIMAASSSDISGPPTMRAALPDANPSAYVGTSTGLGTPVAILSIPLFIALAEWVMG